MKFLGKLLKLIIISLPFRSSSIGASLSELNHVNESNHLNPYLLNLTVIPLNYTLRMRPVLHDGYPGLQKFTSPSEIYIRVESITKASENTITLHQRNLYIDLNNVRVKNLSSGKDLAVQTHTFEPAKDFYTIKLYDSFHFGDKLEIYIPYVVNISQTENVGIYLGHYEINNETRYLSATKLEPYHARKVFPLFDEPNLKAKWNIIVGRLDDGMYRSLSNMEVQRVEKDLDNPGWVWDHYHETVLMPPYLVCIIVCDFVNDTMYTSESNKRITTWAPRHFINRGGGSYGVHTAAKILNFFEKKFKVSYPLNKLDAVALPQFPTGATENFGVVTYRHKNLIWIPGENTESQRRKITQVLGHEISHQWFGNMVTCVWWSDIWLNEGFARYFQFWGMRETIPEFKAEEAFVNDVVQSAMTTDQSQATHSLKNSAKSPNESSAVFDKITYDKGAAILKMMEGFLTPQVFEAGIIDIYLQRLKWKSANQDDLFQALQDSVETNDAMYLLPSSSTIKDIMTPWTIQTGFPLIKVKVVDKSTISISQEKFAVKQNKTSPVKWWVPIDIITDNDASESPFIPVSSFWVPNNISHVKFSSPILDTETKWLMINPNATGYYRVLYDSHLTELIRKQLLLNHTVISSSSRSQLVDDYFNLAFAGYIPIRTVLELLRYLDREIESNVWKSVLVHLRNIRWNFKEDEDAVNTFKNYFVPIMEQALELIGERQLENERGINVTLRVHLYEMVCQLDSFVCFEYANELLTEWEMNPNKNPFPLDLRPILYCPAVASASEKFSSSAWMFMMEKYLESKSISEKYMIMKALTCSRNLTDLENLLSLSIVSNSSKHFSSYKKQILESLIMYPMARPLVYEFMKMALMSKNVSPDTFNDVVRFLGGMPNRPANFGAELEKFIEEYESSLQLDLSQEREKVKMTGIQLRHTLKQIKEPYQCQRCGHWWNTVGNDVVSWLHEQELSSTEVVIDY